MVHYHFLRYWKPVDQSHKYGNNSFSGGFFNGIRTTTNTRRLQGLDKMLTLDEFILKPNGSQQVLC